MQRPTTKADVLRGIQELYIHLRSRGFPLPHIHSDRARELTSDVVKVWAASRDIDPSTNQGAPFWHHHLQALAHLHEEVQWEHYLQEEDHALGEDLECHYEAQDLTREV